MRAIPGMQVFCPADLGELVEALPADRGEPAPRLRPLHARPRRRSSTRRPSSSAGRRCSAHEEGVVDPDLRPARCARPSGRGRPSPRAGCRSASSTCARSSRWTRTRSWTRSRPAELVVTLEDHFHRGGLHTIVAELCLKHRLAPRVLAHRPRQVAGSRPRSSRTSSRHEGLSGARGRRAHPRRPVPPGGERLTMPSDTTHPREPAPHVPLRGPVRPGARPHPRRHPDPRQGARPVRAGRGAQVPRPRAGLPRVGRGRQRVPRLQHGGRAALARLLLPGGGRRDPRAARATGSPSRSCTRSRSRWPSWCARSSPARRASASARPAPT